MIKYTEENSAWVKETHLLLLGWVTSILGEKKHLTQAARWVPSAASEGRWWNGVSISDPTNSTTQEESPASPSKAPLSAPPDV